MNMSPKPMTEQTAIEKEIRELRDSYWKPIQVFRSDAQVDKDELKLEAIDEIIEDILDILRRNEAI